MQQETLISNIYKEIDIVNTALTNLFEHTQIRGQYQPFTNLENYLDGTFILFLADENITFQAEIKHRIIEHHIILLSSLSYSVPSFIVISDVIQPKIKIKLRNHNINYLDGAGNLFIKTETKYLWIDGHKAIPKPLITNRAFGKSGIKVIYHLLTQPELLNQPQRNIATSASVALGNIPLIFNSLKEEGFLVEVKNKQLKLLNKAELIEKWAEAYDKKLKPSLYLGRFKFTNENQKQNWKELLFLPSMSSWGGEAAGALLTNYLNPETFILYTEEPLKDLIKNYRLIPDEDGNIRVYQKFWKSDMESLENMVHPLLAYADLINSNESRSIETAELIYEQFIKPIL